MKLQHCEKLFKDSTEYCIVLLCSVVEHHVRTAELQNPVYITYIYILHITYITEDAM